MILYNVTINIDKDVEMEWVDWMKTKHIPEVMATGMFVKNEFYRLLGEVDNSGITYSIQYFADSMAEIDLYLEKYAYDLRKELMEKYKDKHVAFRTVLESVN